MESRNVLENKSSLGREYRTVNWLDLGLIPYAPAFAIQEQILQARINCRFPPTIILQENRAVFTIGRTGSRSNILASSHELEKRGIEVLEVSRGGDTSYHGPGQLIVSPLLYLGDINLSANQYLHKLEDITIKLLKSYGIQTYKKKEYPGVWWKQAKISSLGIAVKHGYTFHGFALNVNLDLSPYTLINPCGVAEMEVTSLNQVLGYEIPLQEIKDKLRVILQETFVLDTRNVSWKEIQATLAPDDQA